MFAITIKKHDWRLFEIISPVRIPEGTIVTNKQDEPFEVTETTIVIREVFYNTNLIDQMVNEMYEMTEIQEEDL